MPSGLGRCASLRSPTLGMATGGGIGFVLPVEFVVRRLVGWVEIGFVSHNRGIPARRDRARTGELGLFCAKGGRRDAGGTGIGFVSRVGDRKWYVNWVRFGINSP